MSVKPIRFDFPPEASAKTVADALNSLKRGVSRPSDAQLAALKVWREERGRTWRTELLLAWERAGAGVLNYTPELQQLRNEFGPSWLAKYRVPKE